MKRQNAVEITESINFDVKYGMESDRRGSRTSDRSKESEQRQSFDLLKQAFKTDELSDNP
jgi:hypothetical protein